MNNPENKNQNPTATGFDVNSYGANFQHSPPQQPQQPPQYSGPPTPEPGNYYSQSQFAPTAWGCGDAGPEALTMPSGQRVLVRRIGMSALMKRGLIPDLDYLGKLVGSEVIPQEGNARSDVDVKSMDSDKLAELIDVMDRVVVETVVEPKVAMTPNDSTKREANVVYTDLIDQEDKVFLFNFTLGGTRDLERFREESAKNFKASSPG